MEGSAQDGEINTNDWFEFLDDYGASDPAADFTYDGVVNTNDYFAFLAVYGAGTIGSDSLTFGYDDPGGASRAGYAGYRHELAFDETFCDVRYRELDTEKGRWTRRDPLGYVDGASLYAYAAAMPVAELDPYGLAMTNTTGGGGVGYRGGGDEPPITSCAGCHEAQSTVPKSDRGSCSNEMWWHMHAKRRATGVCRTIVVPDPQRPHLGWLELRCDHDSRSYVCSKVGESAGNACCDAGGTIDECERGADVAYALCMSRGRTDPASRPASQPPGFRYPDLDPAKAPWQLPTQTLMSCEEACDQLAAFLQLSYCDALDVMPFRSLTKTACQGRVKAAHVVCINCCGATGAGTSLKDTTACLQEMIQVFEGRD